MKIHLMLRIIHVAPCRDLDNGSPMEFGMFVIRLIAAMWKISSCHTFMQI
jgi:hypothetical protein